MISIERINSYFQVLVMIDIDSLLVKIVTYTVRKTDVGKDVIIITNY